MFWEARRLALIAYNQEKAPDPLFLPVSEGRQAAEMMLIGSSIKVAPVVQWDGEAIGDGKPGRITKKLLEMWNEDARSAADQLVGVPYPD